MTQVFISYSRKDRLLAGKFTESLNQSELETWIDWEDIPATADWLDQIHQGIERSDGFLFLLSPDSVASKVCRQEVDHAVQNAKRLIPIVIRDVDAGLVHPALAKVNWIYCREQDDFDRALEKTLSAIRTDLAWVEFHRRLQVRALEWEKRADPSLLLRGRDLREAEERLALVGQKDPQPTDLQRQYALTSRRRESQTRNSVLVAVVITLVALSLLSVFANNQRILARNNEGTAIANQNAASTAKVSAQNQEGTAVANSQLALARQLAAQSQLLAGGSGQQMMQSALLAVESVRHYPTLEGDQAVRRNWVLFPELLQSMHNDESVKKILFSPDGKLLISAAGVIARVWDVATGKEISRKEYRDLVNDVAISPDNRLVASASGNVIDVWEALTGKDEIRLQHDNQVLSVSFDQDGKMIVSSSADGIARVWNVSAGEEISRMLHNGVGGGAAFSPDGKYVVSAGFDKVQVWEAATGRPVSQISPAGYVFKSVFSPDGRYVASSGDYAALVWDAATGEEVAHIAHASGMPAISFSPNGQWVASGSGDGVWQLWEASTGVLIARGVHDLSAGNDPVLGSVQSLAFSPDGELLLTGSEDGTGRIWEARTGRELLRLAADDYYGADDVIDPFVNTVAFSPDGQLAAFGNGDGLIRIWRNESDAAAMRNTLDYDPNSSIAFSPDEDKMAYMGTDGAVHIWDLGTNSEVIRLPVPSSSGQASPYYYIEQVVFSSDGDRVMYSGSYEPTQIWDLASRREIATIPNYPVTVFSSNGDWIVSTGDDQAIDIWQTRDGKKINRIPVGDTVDLLTISSDGKLVAAETAPGVRVWDVTNGREVSSFQPSGYLTQLAFNPDGNWIVTGSDDGTLTVWEPRDGTKVTSVNHDSILKFVFSPNGRYLAAGSGVHSFDGTDNHGTLSVSDTVSRTETVQIAFDAEVQNLLFSPDGNSIVSFGQSNIARIWDASTGTELSRITEGGTYDYIRTVSFSPSGKWVVTGSDLGLKVWPWHPEDLTSGLCSRLPRNLTHEEWKLFLGNEPYRATCPNLPVEPESTPTPSP
jgi:WD40 repeat protein